MAGEDSSPVEPSKTHIRVGRGGFGNYQEAQKWKSVVGDEPPPQIEPVVLPSGEINERIMWMRCIRLDVGDLAISSKDPMRLLRNGIGDYLPGLPSLRTRVLEEVGQGILRLERSFRGRRRKNKLRRMLNGPSRQEPRLGPLLKPFNSQNRHGRIRYQR
jgi:hypothetical protein